MADTRIGILADVIQKLSNAGMSEGDINRVLTKIGNIDVDYKIGEDGDVIHFNGTDDINMQHYELGSYEDWDNSGKGGGGDGKSDNNDNTSNSDNDNNDDYDDDDDKDKTPNPPEPPREPNPLEVMDIINDLVQNGLTYTEATEYVDLVGNPHVVSCA